MHVLFERRKRMIEMVAFPLELNLIGRLFYNLKLNRMPRHQNSLTDQ